MATGCRCWWRAAGRSDARELSYPCVRPGEVPERLNGHDWKSCDGGRPRPRVRIPPSPLSPALALGPPAHVELGLAVALDVLAEREQLHPVGAGLPAAPGLRLDPHGVVRGDLEGLVVDPERSGAGEHDVDLLHAA